MTQPPEKVKSPEVKQAEEELEQLQKQIQSRKAVLEALGDGKKNDSLEQLESKIKQQLQDIQEKDRVLLSNSKWITEQEVVAEQQKKLIEEQHVEVEKQKAKLNLQEANIAELQKEKEELKLARDKTKTKSKLLKSNQKLYESEALQKSSDHEKLINEKDIKIEQLQKELGTLKEQLASKQNLEPEQKEQSQNIAEPTHSSEKTEQNDQDSQTISKLNVRIEELSLEIKRLEETISQQRKALDKFETSEELVTLKQLLDAKGVKNDTLQAELSALNSKIRCFSEQLTINLLIGHLRKLEKEEADKNNEFTKQISIAEQKQITLSEEIKLLKVNRVPLKEYETVMNDLKFSEEQIQDLTAQLQQLPQLIKSAAESAELIQQHKNKIVAIQRESESKHSDLLAQLRESHALQLSTQELLDSKVQEIRAIQTENEALQKIKDQSNNLITNYRKTILENKEKFDIRTSELDESKYVNEMQDQDIQELKEQINTKESKIKQLNAKVRLIQDRLSAKENEVINFNRVKMMFYSDNERLKDNYQKAQNQLQEFTKKIIPGLKKTADEKENEAKMVRDMLHSQQTMLRVKENEIVRLKARLKKLETIIGESSSALSQNQNGSQSQIALNRKNNNYNPDYFNQQQQQPFLPFINQGIDSSSKQQSMSVEQTRKTNFKNYQNRILESQRQMQKIQSASNGVGSANASLNQLKSFNDDYLGKLNWLVDDLSSIGGNGARMFSGQKSNNSNLNNQQGNAFRSAGRAQMSQNQMNIQMSNSPLNQEQASSQLNKRAGVAQATESNSVFDINSSKEQVHNAMLDTQFSLSPMRVKSPMTAANSGFDRAVTPQKKAGPSQNQNLESGDIVNKRSSQKESSQSKSNQKSNQGSKESNKKDEADENEDEEVQLSREEDGNESGNGEAADEAEEEEEEEEDNQDDDGEQEAEDKEDEQEGEEEDEEEEKQDKKKKK